MSAPFTPRDYQLEARQAVFDYFKEKQGNPLIVAPTASGKSIMIADLIKTIMEFYSTERIVVCTHVKELVQQNYEKFCTMLPFADVGIYSAGLSRKDTQNQILFTSIQSIWKKAVKLQKVDLLIVDEAHMIPAKGLGMWKTFIDELLQINPQMKVIGYTATDFRMDSGSLTTGEGAIFTDVAYKITIPFLISQGYLCEPIPLNMEEKLDVTGVKKAGGEFVAKHLDQAVNRADINERVIAETMKYVHDRKKWMFFCVSVDHCYQIDTILKRYGVKSAVVHAKTPQKERDRIFREYKNGDIQALVNVSVATTGFDAPATDLIIALRPTGSAGLWIQILGRGMRISPETGKQNCLVLDFAENSSRHGPIDMIEGKDKTKGEAPSKVCPNCCAILFAGVLQCKHCGHIFPPPVIDETAGLKDKADKAPILSTQEQPIEWLDVFATTYHKHEKKGKPSSLKVTYQTNEMGFFNEWICLEHSGYARKKAKFWWWQRTGEADAPALVDEALERLDALSTPYRIAVRKEGKYWKVNSYDFCLEVEQTAVTEEIEDEVRVPLPEMTRQEAEDEWNEFY